MSTIAAALAALEAGRVPEDEFGDITPDSVVLSPDGAALVRQALEGAAQREQKIVDHVMRFFSANHCEVHRQEIAQESPGEFADKEQVRGCVRCLAARLARVEGALEESVTLQGHYAELLNMHDGGKRMTFADAQAWLDRLAALAGGGGDATNEG